MTTRRLAAILAADVVGFPDLYEDDVAARSVELGLKAKK
jgi:class 3 adenylate cyclase